MKKLRTLVTIALFFTIIFTSYVYAKNTKIGDVDEEEKWAVIICGGIKNDTRGLDNLQRNITKRVYEIFKQFGYDDEHIYFLQLRNSSGDEQDLPVEVDAFSNKSNAKYAIANWLANNSDENDDCSIFLIDHGNFDITTLGAYFSLYDSLHDKKESIRSVELAEWLENISYNTCTIYIDACFSGGFIKHISGEKRIIMTSTKLTPGVASKTGDFSSFFLDKLEENVSYGEAWEYAGKKHLKIKIRDMPEEAPLEVKIKARIFILIQSPQIDDNGDKRGSGRRFIADKLPIRRDGFLALNTYP